MGMTHKAHCGLFLESLVSCAFSACWHWTLESILKAIGDKEFLCFLFPSDRTRKRRITMLLRDSIVFGTFACHWNTGWMLLGFLKLTFILILCSLKYFAVLKPFCILQTILHHKTPENRKKLHKAPLAGSPASHSAVKCFFFYRRLSLR